MSTDDEQGAPRGLLREVTLTVLGVCDLYETDPALTTALARGLGDVIRARLPGFPAARAWKGKAALRAMVRDLDAWPAAAGAETKGERG
jgi:hypothetical protein